MRRIPVLIVAASLLLLVGCASGGSTRDEFLVGTVETADFVGSAGRRLFYDLPAMLLWEAPKAVFYDFPRAGLLALEGRSATVEDRLDQLASDPGPERELSLSEDLQFLTGLPIRSGSAWLAWGETDGKLPADEWVPRFVEGRITDLTSPDYFTRASAVESLRSLYGTDLDYDPKSDPAGLHSGAARWEEALHGGGLPAPRSPPF